MIAGWKFKTAVGGLVLCVAVLCPGLDAASGQSPTAKTHKNSKKAKKPVPPPDLPSGPTGPVQAMPLSDISPVPPQVSYKDDQLTIVAPNSTLGDILRAVRKQTGAEIEIPSAPERVVTHLGPGPARAIVAELLNGSRFNYVLLGSPSDDAVLTRVVLVAKSGPENVSPSPSGPAIAQQQTPGITPAPGQPQQETGAVQGNEAEAVEENTDDAADAAAAEAEQQAPQNPEQPPVKSPQEMLQEMQQRQLMLQQQQPPGQPPVPGAGMPPRPPQEQQ